MMIRKDHKFLSLQLSRTASIFIALLVTFLWSTSFIIIKLGLREIPPLTFAGLRYAIAFIILLPFAFTPARLKEIRSLGKNQLFRLLLLGFLFYTFTQGTQFIGLSLLPSVTVSLILNFTPILVAVMGIFLINENPTRVQWAGTALFMAGILIYFYPFGAQGGRIAGILVMFVGVIANASSAILGRKINRDSGLSPLTITVISMGFGSLFLLTGGIITQGLPAISFTNLLYLFWLSAVNTALAFTLWNLSLRSLTAMESSIINGTMLIQIAVLAWIFLGETISSSEIAGMITAAIGALLVQISRR